jgi:hypothetical protein
VEVSSTVCGEAGQTQGPVVSVAGDQPDPAMVDPFLEEWPVSHLERSPEISGNHCRLQKCSPSTGAGISTGRITGSFEGTDGVTETQGDNSGAPKLFKMLPSGSREP